MVDMLDAGQRVARILEAAHAAGQEHRRRITTATINMVIRETVNWRAPPTLRGSSKKGRIYYATQACVHDLLTKLNVAIGHPVRHEEDVRVGIARYFSVLCRLQSGRQPSYFL